MTDDVNERVKSDWVAETTPFERIWSVAKRTFDAETASEIAERAHVEVDTARDHLQQLCLVGVIDEDDGRYRRPPESIAAGAARRLLGESDPADIAARVDDWEPDDATSERNLAIAQLALDIHEASEVI